MSDVLTLAAQQRDRGGKGASRAVRRQGRVPAVIYGGKETAQSISLEEKALVKLLNTGFFLNSVVEVEVDGKKFSTLPRDVQFHPVTDRPLHVDFLRIKADSLVTVQVPVRFINEEASPGLKRGGVLNIVRHDIEVSSPANIIPDEIIIDLTGYEVGDSIHAEALQLPEKVVPTIERNFTIATLTAPSALKSEEGAEEGEDGEEAEAEG